MPALSPTMKDGTLIKWYGKEGDKIKPGDVIAEIETDKAAMEIESVDSGIIGKILIPDGTPAVKVGTLIAVLLKNGEDRSILASYLEGKTNSESINKQESKDHKIHTQCTPRQVSNPSDRVHASPLAKQIAKQKNINLSSVTGSGPYGRIVKVDIESTSHNTKKIGYADSISAYQITNIAENRAIPHTTMRNVIAERLSESKQSIPHFYLNIECNATDLLQMRNKMNKILTTDDIGTPCKISVNDLIIKAAGLAIARFPDINSSWSKNEIIQYSNIDISVAVSITGGLVTPIIRNANKRGLVEISQTMKDLAERARNNSLRLDEFQGGGFSITNLGMYGISSFYAIINPPQASILSVGSTHKKPSVLADGSIGPADIMNLGLSVDHRVIDGARAAEFLVYLKQIIENPIMLAT